MENIDFKFRHHILFVCDIFWPACWRILTATKKPGFFKNVAKPARGGVGVGFSWIRWSRLSCFQVLTIRMLNSNYYCQLLLVLVKHRNLPHLGLGYFWTNIKLFRVIFLGVTCLSAFYIANRYTKKSKMTTSPNCEKSGGKESTISQCHSK